MVSSSTNKELNSLLLIEKELTRLNDLKWVADLAGPGSRSLIDDHINFLKKLEKQIKEDLA